MQDRKAYGGKWPGPQLLGHLQHRKRRSAGCCVGAGLKISFKISTEIGTVIGVLNALVAIGVAGQASLTQVAGPIGEAHFDISDVNNTAYAAITAPGAKATVLYRVDLKTGRATRIGTVAGGTALAGLAIEP